MAFKPHAQPAVAPPEAAALAAAAALKLLPLSMPAAEVAWYLQTLVQGRIQLPTVWEYSCAMGEGQRRTQRHVRFSRMKSRLVSAS